MKDLDQLTRELDQHEKTFGFKPSQVEQGSDEWKKIKLGVISASNVSKAVSVRAGKFSDTAKTYMSQIVAEILTGEQKEITGKSLEWGVEHEEEMRMAYSFTTGHPVVEFPFIFKDESMRYGCSPDALTVKGGCEIKCPFASENHVKTVTEGFIKREYIYQVQYSMWVTGRDTWDFCSYDKRFRKAPLHIIPLEKDEKIHTQFDEILPEFCLEVDKKLEKFDVEWGFQWR